MSARKITAEVDGVKLSRRTARHYSHVVVGKLDMHKVLASELAYADERVRDHYAYQSKVAADNDYVSNEVAKWKHLKKEYFEGHVAAAKEFVSKSLEDRIVEAEQVARNRVAAQAKKGKYDKFFALAWCGRYDLAVKQVQGIRNDALYDIRIVEVPAQ